MAIKHLVKHESFPFYVVLPYSTLDRHNPHFSNSLLKTLTRNSGKFPIKALNGFGALRKQIMYLLTILRTMLRPAHGQKFYRIDDRVI